MAARLKFMKESALIKLLPNINHSRFSDENLKKMLLTVIYCTYIIIRIANLIRCFNFQRSNPWITPNHSSLILILVN